MLQLQQLIGMLPIQLQKCIDSFLKTHQNLNYEWFIIDNDSHDVNFDEFKLNYSNNKRIFFIKNDKNEGLAVQNRILEKVRGRYFLMLNPDTWQKEKAIQKLIKFMDSNLDAGIVSAKTIKPDGKHDMYIAKIWTIKKFFFFATKIGKFIDRFLLSYKMSDYYCFKNYNWSINKPIEVDQVSTACMIIRTEIILYDGYIIDPELSFYFNDVDLCKRVLDQGYRVYLLPTAEVIHDHGSSYRKVNPLWRLIEYQKCQTFFFRKYYKRKFWIFRILLIIEILISMSHLRKRPTMKKLKLLFKYAVKY